MCSRNNSNHFKFQPVKRPHAPVIVFMTYCSCVTPSETGTLTSSILRFGNGIICQPKLFLYESPACAIAYWILSLIATRGLVREDCKAPDRGTIPSCVMTR